MRLYEVPLHSLFKGHSIWDMASNPKGSGMGSCETKKRKNQKRKGKNKTRKREEENRKEIKKKNRRQLLLILGFRLFRCWTSKSDLCGKIF